MTALITRRRAIVEASRILMRTGAGMGMLACTGCSGSGGRPEEMDPGERCMSHVLRMGHCAPAVIQTIMEISGRERQGIVRLVAGMPGGIGNTGYECGGVTSPLISLGLRYGFQRLHDGIPFVVYKGHQYLRMFRNRNMSFRCSEIRGENGGMSSCIRAMRHAPEMYSATTRHDCGDALTAESRRSIALLYSHFRRRDFHCALSVLEKLQGAIPVDREMLDGASVFMAGTLFRGMTCGAFTAGVMAIGSALGEIESSRLRVLRMIALMMIDGDAMRDDINRFNRAINAGHRLSQWFTGEYGSTQCREITGCDFTTREGASSYGGNGRIDRCRAIAESVSRRVREMLAVSDVAARS
ncbi:MAG: C-GCAxxG-C-C family protein [Spirochaetes bacterium]|nr:C-GCAxxG-C-C family protein [Spirochaetota bacterium]